MKQRIFVLMLIVIFLMAAAPVHAQDFTPEERELIQFVRTAYENLLTVKSYKADNETSITEDILVISGTETLTLLVDIVQDTTVDYLNDPGGGQWYIQMTQNLALDMGFGNTGEQILVMEMVFDGQDYYVRFNEVPPDQAYLYPSGWATLEDIPGSELLNIEQYEAYANLNILLEAVTEENILGIVELPEQTIDGIDMRVIEVTWKFDRLMEVQGTANLLNLAALGDLGEQVIQGMIERGEAVQIIWIGVADTLIHRTQNEISVANLPVSAPEGDFEMTIESTTISTFYDFNKPVDIPIPVIGE